VATLMRIIWDSNGYRAFFVVNFTTVSVSETRVSNGRMNWRKVNWKGSGRKRSWLNRDTLLQFVWQGCGNSRKWQLRIVDVQVEIEIEHPRRTSLKRLPLNQLARFHSVPAP
jgi:hypothetical protein